MRASAVSDRQAGLSIVTAARGGLETILKRWAAQADVDEIVAVAFDGATARRGSRGAAKTVVVQVAGEEPWAKGLALNIGIEAASRDTILVLDPGHQLRDIGGYRRAIAAHGGYLTGYGIDKSVASEVSMFRHADWASIGGYHEYLLGWGFEDEDLFNRLEDAGVAHRFFRPEDFSGAGGEVVAAAGSDLGLELPEGLERHRWFQNNRNKILAGLAPWSAVMPLRSRRFGRPRAGVLTCELAPRTTLERRLQDCASYFAARFLHNVPESVALPMLARMVDERFTDYALRAGRQHQIDKAVAARRRRA